MKKALLAALAVLLGGTTSWDLAVETSASAQIEGVTGVASRIDGTFAVVSGDGSTVDYSIGPDRGPFRNFMFSREVDRQFGSISRQIAKSILLRSGRVGEAASTTSPPGRWATATSALTCT